MKTDQTCFIVKFFVSQYALYDSESLGVSRQKHVDKSVQTQHQRPTKNKTNRLAVYGEKKFDGYRAGQTCQFTDWPWHVTGVRAAGQVTTGARQHPPRTGCFRQARQRSWSRTRRLVRDIRRTSRRTVPRRFADSRHRAVCESELIVFFAYGFEHSSNRVFA